MTAAEHWENIYATKDYAKVGWHQDEPTLSLELIRKVSKNTNESIIDIGCGTSLLADRLISSGYKNISLLDISKNAIEITKQRIGEKAASANVYICDVCGFKTENRFDIWHDRAVFHFLQELNEQRKYFDILKKHLNPGGYAIIATFSKTGPSSCSGLPVKRYDKYEIAKILCEEFEIIDALPTEHITPTKSKHDYIYFLIKRIDA